MKEIDRWIRRKLRVSHRDAYVIANSRKGNYHVVHMRSITSNI